MSNITKANNFIRGIETLAYGTGKLKPGGLNTNDSKLSSQELRTAINTGKLNKNESMLAQRLLIDFRKLDTMTSGGDARNQYTFFGKPDSKLEQRELVKSMSLFPEQQLWSKI